MKHRFQGHFKIAFKAIEITVITQEECVDGEEKVGPAQSFRALQNLEVQQKRRT